MNGSNDRTEDALSLIEHNREFLRVGKFLDNYIKHNDLSSNAKDLLLEFKGGKTYLLNGDPTRESLRCYFGNQNIPNVFGYLVEWNAFRGIGMAMYEGLKNDSLFKNFMKKKLGNRYEHYHAILCFIRNVLSHNIHDEIRLKLVDYKGTSNTFQTNHADGVATFSISYADDFPELNAPSNYEFKMEVDFKSLNPGKRFIEIISEWHLYMFSELCFNLAMSFRKQNGAVSN